MRTGLHLLLFGFCLVAGSSFVVAAEVEITGVELGFDDAYRCGTWTPVQVSLRTQVVPFSGEVGISEDGLTEFRATVALAANTTGRAQIPAILKGQVSRLWVRAYVASLKTPVFSGELSVSTTLVPSGALMFLADADVPASRVAEFEVVLAKEVGGDASAEVRICRVHLTEFPRRVEYYEPFDGLILSEGAQVAVASDKMLTAILGEYGKLMGIVLALQGGQLTSKIQPRREMLSFPYRYRICEETGALFEPRPWAPQVKDLVVFTTSLTTLLLAIVALLVVRGSNRAAKQAVQRLSRTGCLARTTGPFLPAVLGLACAATILGWEIDRLTPSCRRAEFRFFSFSGSIFESDEFFLIEGHGKDCTMLQAQGEGWLAPCVRRNVAKALVVSFDADLRQKFLVQDSRPGDSMLLSMKRLQTQARDGNAESGGAPRSTSEQDEQELVALAVTAADSFPDWTIDSFVTDGFTVWQIKDVRIHLVRMSDDARLPWRDLKVTLPRVLLSRLIEEWYAGDPVHRAMARQLDFWRRMTAKKNSPALLLFRQARLGNAQCRTAPFTMAPDRAPPADIMSIWRP
jgi:hypothetical protein